MKNHLRTVFFLGCLFTLSLLSAQRPPGSFGGGRGGGPSIVGTVKGEVFDPAAKAPVEFATVVLLSPGGEKQIDGIVTEADGSFKLTDVKAGKYWIKVSFIGYEDLMLREVETTPKSPDLDLGRVELNTNAVLLETAEVTGEAALVENRIDKLVYNADKDATNVGGDATDVLRKVPLLSVDLEGNVSLRGSQNIQVLVNGRPSTIFATSIADALRTIPSDQIKTVEVITTPSARYDGEGSGGIINIITKKKDAQGFTGTVSSSIGTRQNNAGLNVNALFGRFGLNGGLNSFWSWRRPGDNEFLRQDFGTGGEIIRTLSQMGTSANRVLGMNGSGGAFYDFNAYNSINASFRYNRFGRWNDGTTTGSLDAVDLINFSRFSDSRNDRSGFDFTLDYRKTWADVKDKELIFAFQYSGNDSDQENVIDQDGDLPVYQNDIRNFNDGINREYTAQVDYVQPFGKHKLETGVKSVIRRIDSDYRTLLRGNDNADFEVQNSLTDFFLYDQDVHAGYVSVNLSLGDKWGLVAGTRYELTDIRGDYNSENPSFANDYANLLPSIILNRKLTQFSNLKASYTQRIQRPGLRFINPFTAIGDPNNIQIGNPLLDPERVDQYELAYNNFIKGVVLNASVFYRRTTDIIESFLQVEDDGIASSTTFLNIGEADNYGVNFFTSATLWKILTLRGSINYLRYNGEGIVRGERLSRSANIWSGNASGSLKLTDDLRLDGFWFFRGQRQTLQGQNPAFGIFSLGANWQITERTSLGIRAVEPFVENKPFESELRGQDFYQFSRFEIPFRSIGLSFSHKFGQIDFRAQNRRTRVRNDDQKGGGDSQQF